MAKVESLGIKRVDSVHYYVRDLERSQRFYVDYMDFEELGQSSPELEAEGKQRSMVFRAGDCVVMCSTPLGEGGRAQRYLKKHPDGIGTVIFEVEDVEKAFRMLEERGGTPISEVRWFDEDGKRLGTFSITTPFGDTTFRFVERQGYTKIYPGMLPHTSPKGGKNRFGFGHFDHITSNFQTMKPALLWMEYVMGFEQFWDVQFHTEDVSEGRSSGSGLRSIVMNDPKSGVKFANNEPWRPFFKNSQINIFNEDHRGDGVQHLAITCKDIVTAVRDLRANGVQFMPTPGAYYDALPERLKKIGVGSIDEEIDLLRELEVLVDGDHDHAYMLQIFLKDSAGLYGAADAGPFFYEIIQRKGDQGFGAGNFRALFESIEREQTGRP
ncbi:MAG: 4-hydroxyphenylpyruvate dioxygenase [Polyangiaceae bacterium]|nr:4-hydroxyphenylpyruvate dioxygenase [Polyangiaceae bacterium]MCB9607223.1 4-hydroxyphenylpyruvate dioxygenase [Polyangiaceae bacterium]